MAGKKGGLGKGLDSLISNKVNTQQLNTGIVAQKEAKEAVFMVKLSKVEPNKEQPRQSFDEASLAELADSIKQYGVLQPLLVQDQKTHYEIIAGERRWRAAKLAGLKEIPVIVRDSTQREVMEIALIENIQRENLNPIEEAQAFKRLLEEFKLKQEEVAARVSKSRTAVTNALRLLKLCAPVQQMVIDGELTTGHARCLITVKNEEEQTALAKQIFDNKLSVRETEQLVKKTQEKTTTKTETAAAKSTDTATTAIYDALAEDMKQVFGTKVQIRQKSETAGKIEIAYYSTEDLDRIYQMVLQLPGQEG